MKRDLKIKVCGMRDIENIRQVEALKPDMMGFIVYAPSSRFIGTNYTFPIQSISSIQRVAVFVNEDINTVDKFAIKHNINTIQLHGQETPQRCEQLLKSGKEVWKAFSIDENFDFEILKNYEGTCTRFLFDKKGKLPGGNGAKFDWSILKKYTGNTPFLLSGGIGPNDADAILNFEHPQFDGVDINSGFEISPANKDVIALRNFFETIRSKK